MKSYVKRMNSSYDGYHLSVDFIDITVKSNNFTASQNVRYRALNQIIDIKMK